MRNQTVLCDWVGLRWLSGSVAQWSVSCNTEVVSFRLGCIMSGIRSKTNCRIFFVRSLAVVTPKKKKRKIKTSLWGLIKKFIFIYKHKITEMTTKKKMSVKTLKHLMFYSVSPDAVFLSLQDNIQFPGKLLKDGIINNLSSIFRHKNEVSPKQHYILKYLRAVLTWKPSCFKALTRTEFLFLCLKQRSNTEITEFETKERSLIYHNKSQQIKKLI